MTSTLLDQGDGYLKMKNLRKKEQEESIIMKENMDENMNENMDDNDNNTAYKEGFVESMDNSNDKSFSEILL